MATTSRGPKIEAISQMFDGIVDPSKSVEQNIKKLFAHRAKLIRLNKDYKNIIIGIGKERIYKAIGKELSKLIH